MDAIFVSRVIFSFVAGGLFVALQSLLAERSPQHIAGIMMSIPSTIAIGLLFIGIAISPEAVTEAVSGVPHSIGASLIFVATYVYFANAFRLPSGGQMAVSFVFGTLVWLALVVPIGMLELSGKYSIGMYILFLLIAHYLLSVRPQIHTVPARMHFTANQICARSIVGGTIVAAVVVIAKILGPYWGGVTSGYPAAYFSTLLIIHWSRGPKFLFHVVNALAKASPVLIIYAFTVGYAYPSIGLFWGTVLGYAVSLLYPLCIITFFTSYFSQEK